MAPPPITPSPHRFITSKPANPATKPSSSLRFQQGAPQSISSQQFTPAPRFSFGSTQKLTVETAAPASQHASPLSRRLRLPASTPNKTREDIEDTTSKIEKADGLRNDLSTFAPPPEQPTLKRRQPDPPEAITVSSEPSSPSPPPTTPSYPTVEEDDLEADPHKELNQSTRPRFVLPAPKPTGTPSIPNRPPLILPPRSPSPPVATPAFFSPHRRGQKYIPGGLACAVRDWIVETSQQAHNRAHGSRGEEESWDTRFRVGEFRAQDLNGGNILVQERSEGNRWMLVGMGRGDIRVEVGCLVGVREPTWEVPVGHEIYRVAIEWKVLIG